MKIVHAFALMAGTALLVSGCSGNDAASVDPMDETAPSSAPVSTVIPTVLGGVHMSADAAKDPSACQITFDENVEKAIEPGTVTALTVCDQGGGITITADDPTYAPLLDALLIDPVNPNTGGEFTDPCPTAGAAPVQVLASTDAGLYYLRVPADHCGNAVPDVFKAAQAATSGKLAPFAADPDSGTASPAPSEAPSADPAATPSESASG